MSDMDGITIIIPNSAPFRAKLLNGSKGRIKGKITVPIKTEINPRIMTGQECNTAGLYKIPVGCKPIIIAMPRTTHINFPTAGKNSIGVRMNRSQSENPTVLISSVALLPASR